MKMILLGAPVPAKAPRPPEFVNGSVFLHISTGDMFRENMSNNTELGRLAKQYIDAGKLVPDEVTLGMVKQRLAQEDCQNGFLLDGFPRTIDRLRLQALTALDCVLNIDVDESLLLRVSPAGGSAPIVRVRIMYRYGGRTMPGLRFKACAAC